jgi:hypothetical protein
VKFEYKMLCGNKMEMCQNGHLCPETTRIGRGNHKILIIYCEFKTDFEFLMSVRKTAMPTTPGGVSPFVLRANRGSTQ